MQKFVEEYIAAQKALLQEESNALTADKRKKEAEDREAHLIRLGMCEKEYSDSTVYNADYPYQEYKTGRYYRLVPFTVSDEEYAAICHYGRLGSELAPHGPARLLFGRSAARARRLALPVFVLGVLLSFFLAAFLYMNESSFLLLAAGTLVAGLGISYILGLLLYNAGETLSRLDALRAESLEADLVTNPEAEPEKED